jgi:hypothetical protein
MTDGTNVPQARNFAAYILENSRGPLAALGRRIFGRGSQLADRSFANRGQFIFGLLACRDSAISSGESS